jgi:hypothetical protein
MKRLENRFSVERGLERGVEQGVEQGRERFLLALLRNRFGGPIRPSSPSLGN